MVKNILNILKTLGSYKKKMKIFVSYSLINAILEIIGVALVVPILTIILSEDNKINFEINNFFINHSYSFDKENILFLAVIFIVIFFSLKTVFITYFHYWRSNFIFSLNEMISNNLFSIYLNQPYKFHILRNSSESTRNLIAVQNYVRNIDQCAHLLTEIIILISFFFVLLFYEPMVTIYISIISFIFGLIYLKKVNPINFKVGEQSHSATQKIIKNINQGLFGIKDIKLYGREKDFLKSFSSNIKTFSKSLTVFEFLQPLPRILLELLAVLMIITTVIILYFLEYQNSKIIIFVALLAAVGFKLIPSMNKVLFAIQHLKYYLPLSKNIYQELSLENLNNKILSGHINFKKNIEFKNIHFSYENTEILTNINFEVRKNSAVGIVGKTGSGKTTLINIFLGLLEQSQGEILIDDIPIKLNQRAWQNKIGYVPQDIYLIDDTIEKNIAFGILEEKIDKNKIKNSLKMSQLSKYVNSLENGVKTIVGENGAQLSGGQIQRIGIARAVYNDPDILVFDEPSSSLDEETEINFIKAISELKNEKTIVIISHRKNALSFCDDIYELKNNQILKLHENIP